jgi:hypothetical protein
MIVGASRDRGNLSRVVIHPMGWASACRLEMCSENASSQSKLEWISREARRKGRDAMVTAMSRGLVMVSCADSDSGWRALTL